MTGLPSLLVRARFTNKVKSIIMSCYSVAYKAIAWNNLSTEVQTAESHKKIKLHCKRYATQKYINSRHCLSVNVLYFGQMENLICFVF